nr:PREDICTED: uncharacterized protein LOC105662018 [Megachile rotundata]
MQGTKNSDKPGDLSSTRRGRRPSDQRKLLSDKQIQSVNGKIPASRSHRVSDSDSYSIESKSTSSKGSALSGKSLKRSTNEDSKDVKRQRNVDTSGSGKDRKAQRTATMERLSNFHAKLGRGLKSISDRARPRQKIRPENGARRFKVNGREEKSDELKKDSMTMKQLFSTTESWSSDSVVSESDNCACCHKKEPCPLHRNYFFDGR